MAAEDAHRSWPNLLAKRGAERAAFLNSAELRTREVPRKRTLIVAVVVVVVVVVGGATARGRARPEAHEHQGERSRVGRKRASGVRSDCEARGNRRCWWPPCDALADCNTVEAGQVGDLPTDRSKEAPVFVFLASRAQQSHARVQVRSEASTGTRRVSKRKALASLRVAVNGVQQASNRKVGWRSSSAKWSEREKNRLEGRNTRSGSDGGLGRGREDTLEGGVEGGEDMARSALKTQNQKRGAMVVARSLTVPGPRQAESSHCRSTTTTTGPAGGGNNMGVRPVQSVFCRC